MPLHNPAAHSDNYNELVAKEKLGYMLDYAKTSTIATIVAPLLCIPLYSDNTPELLFKSWLVLMAIVVLVRLQLIRVIKASSNITHNFTLLNIAVGSVTLVWGLGWFIFVIPEDPVSYLLYQIICLTILFVGMVGYCVDWKTFCAFIVPLKGLEIIFLALNYQDIIWPISAGSMVAFYLALKMGFLFSKSWERSFSLRLKNDTLYEQLVVEKNASIAANIAKSEFIATASHDLRQPMQAINIFIEMIDHRHLQEYESSVFHRIRKSVSVLNKMFNTLLDISKLDSNLTPIETHFSLGFMVNDLRHSFADLCQEKGLGLAFTFEDGLIQGDPHLTEQILRNLLSNAIQYTDRGSIHVNFENDQGHLNFSVEDTGCGIPPTDMSLIFNEFYRSDHSRSHHDGLGLGLSIVIRIVKKIGGECAVVSEVGKGSKFTIKTPFLVLKSLESPSSTLSMNAKPFTNWVDASIRNAANKVSKSSLHIGIIENDDSLRDAYLQYFTTAGYQVCEIPHQEDKFHAFLQDIPKLNFILSDFRLGQKDGIYYIQTLREEFNDEIPACIVTADTSPQHLEMFKQFNIHVLHKPIDIQDIEEFILQQTFSSH
jgi:signal transduction histidine kinase/CheY-like chemotaxis protein